MNKQIRTFVELSQEREGIMRVIEFMAAETGLMKCIREEDFVSVEEPSNELVERGAKSSAVFPVRLVVTFYDDGETKYTSRWASATAYSEVVAQLNK